MKKMNNKGFSLVELIVVVLIMAIIAVALAPQVMKWVENSRVSTDCTNYESLVENLQLAIADKDCYKAISVDGAEGKVVTAVIDDDSTTIGKTGDTGSAYANDIATSLAKIDSSYAKIAKKSSAATPATYEITITLGKQANVAKSETLNPEVLKNGTDLS